MMVAMMIAMTKIVHHQKHDHIIINHHYNYYDYHHHHTTTSTTTTTTTSTLQLTIDRASILDQPYHQLHHILPQLHLFFQPYSDELIIHIDHHPPHNLLLLTHRCDDFLPTMVSDKNMQSCVACVTKVGRQMDGYIDCQMDRLIVQQIDCQIYGWINRQS